MKPTHRKSLRSLAIFGVIAAVGYWALHRAFNPSDLNHLVIIRQNATEFSAPLQATLHNGNRIQWKMTLDLGTRPGSLEKAPLDVVNIPNAWLGERLRITDSLGQVLADVEVQPRGRYCGSLVILIDQDGQAHAAFNEMPNAT